MKVILCIALLSFLAPIHGKGLKGNFKTCYLRYAFIHESLLGCTINDFAYGGGDILVSGKHNIQSSWEDCQTSCQAITDCHYWTWFKPDYNGNGKTYCELKFEAGGIPLPGTISGPRSC